VHAPGIVKSQRESIMCGCCSPRTEPTEAGQKAPDAIVLRVEDMTCGHCAGAIRHAIETGLPGTQVEADPASKLVAVRGSTDLAAIRSLVTQAGYSPALA
jgi:copper chaperone